MKELIYNHTTLNINLCNIIDLYSVFRPRCYSKELLRKTRDLISVLNHHVIHIKKCRIHLFYDQWVYYA
jgi:hypothetical protein